MAAGLAGAQGRWGKGGEGAAVDLSGGSLGKGTLLYSGVLQGVALLGSWKPLS